MTTETPSAPAEADKSPFDHMLRDLFHDRSWVSSPAVSPDGQRIAFVVSTIDLDANTTTSRVWLKSPDGEPTPVTAGPNDAQPAWSPDGRSLAFTSKRGEKEKEATLHVLPVGVPGEVRTIGSMPEGFGEPQFSPDGRWIAFISRTRDKRYEAKDESWQPPRKLERLFSRFNGEGWVFDRPTHVYVVAADGTGTPRNLTPGEFQHDGISWLPDSSAIVTSAARHESWDLDLARDLYVVPLDGDIRPLTAQTGQYANPSVSPDGTKIAFLGVDDPQLEPQNASVGIIDAAGGEIRWVSNDLDRNFAPYPGARAPVWTDPGTVLATVEDHGETHLYEVAADGSRAPQQVTKGAVTVSGFDARGGTVALVESTVEQPGELATLVGRITTVARNWLGWERFSVPCSDRSGDIDAWIMRPRDFDESRTYPVLINVHGGPFTQYGETFFDEAQLQAAAGFVVLMSNPRGSSGRDTAWGQAIRGPKADKAPGTGWGSVDVDDVLAVLDTALERYPFCDRDRVGMLGGSYGGYMATTLAGRYSDRFRAICTERAANNLITEEFSADIAGVFHTILGPRWIDDPDEYARMSPVGYVRNIDCPVLIIHSEDDLRCPVNQAEELFVAMRLLGKDVTFYRFPGENHELSRSGSPVHRTQRAKIILEYFTEKLAARS